MGVCSGSRLGWYGKRQPKKLVSDFVANKCPKRPIDTTGEGVADYILVERFSEEIHNYIIMFYKLCIILSRSLSRTSSRPLTTTTQPGVTTVAAFSMGSCDRACSVGTVG